jgi:hypothetical protein
MCFVRETRRMRTVKIIGAGCPGCQQLERDVRAWVTQQSSTPMLSAPEDKQRLCFGSEYFVRAASRSAAEDFMAEVVKDYLR